MVQSPVRLQWSSVKTRLAFIYLFESFFFLSTLVYRRWSLTCHPALRRDAFFPHPATRNGPVSPRAPRRGHERVQCKGRYFIFQREEEVKNGNVEAFAFFF